MLLHEVIPRVYEQDELKKHGCKMVFESDEVWLSLAYFVTKFIMFLLNEPAQRGARHAEQVCVLWVTRVIIPPKNRNRVLEELHETVYRTNCRTKAYAISYIWWPSVDSQMEEYLKSCESCQMFRNKPAHAPLHPWKFPARDWERIHIDYGTFDKKMLLIIIDSYSKWIEVHEVSST